MKIYIRSSTELKTGAYMVSRDGDVTQVYYHAPSTSYEDRKIYHLCPTDADFLYSKKQISKDDGVEILKYCLAEYLKANGADDDHEITSGDIGKFASFADLIGVPWLYEVALDFEGETIAAIEADTKSFDKLNDKWYTWLKNNFVKLSISNNKAEFRIGSEDNYDWNDVIIDDIILQSNLKDNDKMKYNILRQSGKGYKAYFQDATLNDILEDDKKILSDEDIMSSTSIYATEVLDEMTGFLMEVGDTAFFYVSKSSNITDGIARAFIDRFCDWKSVSAKACEYALHDPQTITQFKRKIQRATLTRYDTGKIEYFSIKGRGFTLNFPEDDFKSDVIVF